MNLNFGALDHFFLPCINNIHLLGNVSGEGIKKINKHFSLLHAANVD